MLKGMKFVNSELEREFKKHVRKQWTESLVELEFNRTPPRLYNSFHKVLAEWGNKGGLSLDDFLYFGKSKTDFDEIFHKVIEEIVFCNP